ncbi:MAG: DUF2079 domain-containing protein, partial [Chloroflexota bacterium]|nr:DUF2079 domain-containing protein [Chloroflexota bacterium]
NRTVDHFAQLREAPAATLATLLTERVPLAARWLLAPTGGVALLAPQVLLIDLPDAAVLVMADKEQRFRRHWVAPTLPIIWLATVVGLARLRHPPLRALGIGALVLGMTWTYVLDSDLPGGGDSDPSDLVWTERSEQMDYLVRRVPPDASVAASRRVLGDLANRAELYVFPPSYMGKLWPPNRRPQVYLLDLTNDGTREALLGRQSPLRTTRTPYAIWLAGPDGMLLAERPPAPVTPVEGDSAGIRLTGLDATRDDDSLDVTLHWSATHRPDRALTRVVRVLDAGGGVIAERRGTALDELFPTTEWPAGQIVLDRLRMPLEGRAPLTVAAGWETERGQPDLIEVPLP